MGASCCHLPASVADASNDSLIEEGRPLPQGPLKPFQSGVGVSQLPSRAVSRPSFHSEARNRLARLPYVMAAGSEMRCADYNDTRGFYLSRHFARGVFPPSWPRMHPFSFQVRMQGSLLDRGARVTVPILFFVCLSLAPPCALLEARAAQTSFRMVRYIRLPNQFERASPSPGGSIVDRGCKRRWRLAEGRGRNSPSLVFSCFPCRICPFLHRGVMFRFRNNLGYITRAEIRKKKRKKEPLNLCPFHHAHTLAS